MAQRGTKIEDNVAFQFRGQEYGIGSIWDLYTETINGMKHIIYAEINDMWFALDADRKLIECDSEYPLMQGLPPDEEDNEYDEWKSMNEKRIR